LSRHDLEQQPRGATGCSALSKRLDDFEDFRELFGQWDGEFRQMSRGEFHGSIALVQGRILRIFHAESNQAILVRGADSADLATFIPITRRNESTVWQGRSLQRGQMIAKSPEVGYQNLSRRDVAIRSVLLPRERLRHAAHLLTGRAPEELIPSWAALRPAPVRVARFERAIESLLVSSLRNPAWLATPAGEAAESECLRYLVDALVDPDTQDATPRRPRGRLSVVARAADFMHHRLTGPVSALDLCAQLGVSDRTLRRAFHDAFGMGPLAYQRLLRLHATRAALKAGDGADNQVGDIARRWGFNRLGAFAADYCRQFGELPSQTLRRCAKPSSSSRSQVSSHP